MVAVLAELRRLFGNRLEMANLCRARRFPAFPGGRRFHFIDLDDYELAVWSAQ